MYKDVLKTMEDRCQKSIYSLKEELKTIRAGRANPSLLDGIKIDYYGQPTPLNQIAGISVPEPRLLTIQPWDKSTLPEIEKQILASNLGITPSNDGTVIRLPFPQLTEERRKELAKVVKKYGENSKVSVRNIRRDAQDEMKKLEKQKEITEDELHRSQDDIQKITDKYIEQIEKICKEKDAELMEI